MSKWKYAAPVLVVAAALAAPLVISAYLVSLLGYIFVSAIAVVGLVVLTGAAGLVSFGQAGFVAIGAYTTAYLTVALGWSPWLTLIVAVLLAGASAAIIGYVTARMNGHYLALATIAWAVSIYYLLGNIPALGQYNGFGGIPPVKLLGYELRNDRALYYFALLSLITVTVCTANLLNSRYGRAIRATKQGALLAESVGANSAALKILVFVYAGCVAAVAGWAYAHLQRFINPSAFGIAPSVEYLFMAVIGGVDSIWGALIGAASVTILKNFLQFYLPDLVGQSGNFQIAVFGVIMLIILQRANTGIWPHLAKLLAFGVRAAPVEGSADNAFQTKSAGAECLLDIRNATKSFGGLTAVDDLSFILGTGEILGLLGPNGAGKSTMFDMVSGAQTVTAGEIWFGGTRINGEPARRIARRGVARTFQHVKLVATLSVLDNATLGLHQHGRVGVIRSLLRLNRREERTLRRAAAHQLTRVGLGACSAEQAGNLPLGQQRLLEIARALAAGPTLLLLDEPAAGLRYQEKQALVRLLLQLRTEGLAILLVEHDMDFVVQVADRLVVMQNGRKIAEGRPRDVQRDPQVRLAYLGPE